MLNNPILIIHNSEHSEDRSENVEKLSQISSNSTIIEAKFDFTNDEILYWTNSENFYAMPAIMYSEKIMGRVGCLLSHMKCLKHIVTNKLNNTIILEDDAIYNGQRDWYDKDLDEVVKDKKNSSDYIVYLGYSINPKNGKVFCCHSYMIPSWEKAEFILKSIEEKNPKKAIDVMYINLIQRMGYNFSYFDIFGQIPGYSYIDKKIKKKPGKWN